MFCWPAWDYLNCIKTASPLFPQSLEASGFSSHKSLKGQTLIKSDIIIAREQDDIKSIGRFDQWIYEFIYRGTKQEVLEMVGGKNEDVSGFLLEFSNTVFVVVLYFI